MEESRLVLIYMGAMTVVFGCAIGWIIYNNRK